MLYPAESDLGQAQGMFVLQVWGLREHGTKLTCKVRISAYSDFFEDFECFEVSVVEVPRAVHGTHLAVGIKAAFYTVGEGCDFSRK